MSTPYKERSHGDLNTPEVILAQYVMLPDGRVFWTDQGPHRAQLFTNGEWLREMAAGEAEACANNGLRPFVGYMRMLRAAYDALPPEALIP